MNEHCNMDKQLQLANIRRVLIRLEETLIFGIIERAQFRHNPVIYRSGGVGHALKNQSLLDFLLRESERSHALVRRYTSPDEHPFFEDLPEPILPALDYSGNPLHANRININQRIRQVYEHDIIPAICEEGDDGHFGSSAVNDVTLLQALSKRIHYGKFVAESKYRSCPDRFTPWIKSQDRTSLLNAITDQQVEAQVLERVRLKATTYGRELDEQDTAGHNYKVPPALICNIYSQWIIPMNKEVQVLYLLTRLDD
jgi:chorismate mutase